MEFISQAHAALNGETVDIKTLVAILQECKELYYNQSGSYLDDAQFDFIENVLRQQDPHNDYFKLVGVEPARSGKVDLPCTMASLDQVSVGQWESWIVQNKLHNVKLIWSEKLDGVSCLLHFVAGKLKTAYTRGSATQGQDITRHILQLKTVPHRIETNQDILIRAEIILQKDKLWEVNIKAQQQGMLYKNIRNFVAGQVNRKQALPVFLELAHVVCYEIIGSNETKQKQFQMLGSWGFEIAKHSLPVDANKLLEKDLEQTIIEIKNNGLYEIDGLVIELNDPKDYNLIEDSNSSNINPKYAKKYKILDQHNIVETTVVDVEWQISKAGYIKPRLVVEAVDMQGITITHATAFNAKFVIDNGLGPGAKVKITRSGDVIPYILQVTRTATAKLPNIDSALYKWNKTAVDFELIDAANNEECQKQMLMAACAILEIDHLREGNVVKLYDAGINTLSKIITATRQQFVAAIGDAIGNKAYDSKQQKLSNTTLPKLAAASHIFGRGIGERKISKVFESLDLNKITIENVVAIEGFEIKTAQKIVENIEQFLKFLNDIAGHYVLQTKQIVSDDLQQYVVVFTGVRDKELEQTIESRGGQVASGISKNVTHLVCKDVASNSSKMQKAADQGIAIIDITTARKLFS